MAPECAELLGIYRWMEISDGRSRLPTRIEREEVVQDGAWGLVKEHGFCHLLIYLFDSAVLIGSTLVSVSTVTLIGHLPPGSRK